MCFNPLPHSLFVSLLSLARRQKGGPRRPSLDTLTFVPWGAGRLGLDCGNDEAEEYTVLILQDETVWPDSGGFLSCFSHDSE